MENEKSSRLFEFYEMLLMLIPIMVFGVMFLMDYLSGEPGNVQL